MSRRGRGDPGMRQQVGDRSPPQDGRSTARDARPGDSGVATVWAALAIAVIMSVTVVGVQLGAAVVARHRAAAAADLAALAAAGWAVNGAEAACARAGDIARAMGATLAGCALDGWEAQVTVQVRPPFLPLVDGVAEARARAGPEPTPPPGAAGLSAERSDGADGRTTSGNSPVNAGSTRQVNASAQRQHARRRRSTNHRQPLAADPTEALT